MSWIIPEEHPVPGDMTLRHGLYCLYAVQQWETMTQPASGPYKAGYFYGAIDGVLSGLARPSRQTALRHIAESICTVCHASIDTTHSVLDHLMPTSRGGPDTLDNTCLLCRRCNSSKGAKDLLQWWGDKAFDVMALDRRVICLYARVSWQYSPCEALRQAAPAALCSFLATRAAQSLPTDHHRIALHGSAYAACALMSWLSLTQQKGAVHA